MSRSKKVKTDKKKASKSVEQVKLSRELTKALAELDEVSSKLCSKLDSFQPPPKKRARRADLESGHHA